MCMSPDEMSDDRIREAIEYYTEAAIEERLEGNETLAKRLDAGKANFQALLDEREAARAAEIEEALAPVVLAPVVAKVGELVNA